MLSNRSRSTQRILLSMLTLLVAAAMARSEGVEARIACNGSLSLLVNNSRFATLEPNAHDADWQAGHLSVQSLAPTGNTDTFRGRLLTESGGVINFDQQIVAEGDSVRCSYILTPAGTMQLRTLHVGLEIPASDIIGGHFAVDGRQVADAPRKPAATVLWSGKAKTLGIKPPGQPLLLIEFARPTQCLIQDNRRWSDQFVLRLGPQFGEPTEWPARKDAGIAFTLSVPGGLKLAKERAWKTTATAEWIPLDDELAIVAGSALDFSRLVPRHDPAGQSGRLIATSDGHFAFEKEPGRHVRFYGVNLCFAAQYLSHADADRLADQLARIGYNAVRFHHYDNELADYSRGEELQLKPEPLDQLDYLFAALKKRGFYMTTDLFVSRRVPERILWPDKDGTVEMNAYKFAVRVNDRAFADYRRFSELLLGHVNPYTGLSYAADPALATICLVNEGNPGNSMRLFGTGLLGDDTRASWKQWLRENGHNEIDPAVLPSSLERSTTETLFGRFLADLESRFWKRSVHFIRNDAKCQALLTDMNGWSNPLPVHRLRADFDYVDDHFYVNHPAFPEKPWSLPATFHQNDPVSGVGVGGASNAFVRVAGKPFTITEFNYPYPLRWRCAGGLITGAVAGLQDWSGLWRFAYGHSSGILKPGTAGYFDIFADPLNLASERAAICLFLRGDAARAGHEVAIAIPSHAAARKSPVPNWLNLALVTRIASCLETSVETGDSECHLLLTDGKASEPLQGISGSDVFDTSTGKRLVDELRRRGWLLDNGTSLERRVFESETGQISLDPPRHMFSVVTSETVGLFASSPNRLDTPAARLELKSPGAVWVSSLDGKTLGDSTHMLITHLTDLVNSDELYADEERRVYLVRGRLPHLVRAGQATAALSIPPGAKVRVYSLATSGRRTGEMESHTDGRVLTIPLSISSAGRARLFYEVIVAER